ncbi:energy-coupling factor ABC transporter ATP-binding protein [Sporolactobacillus sp. Y61]|jgi:energy-coupling factor transport system ATP-binding protein|uniref:Energy-coupling factor ABC transporter ATP-binding protein n=1 Tax=Sporolactobacillus sp. Y61 TaxID=3160863 RepID=A0AAU8IH49_9BACL|nr:energy-coupling factor ABC transporter ATP-binding protein [Sporolactobacillus sp. THM19-2]RYL89407.1 energy-coupling factor ABC transporter ATP-binding protein [Sporolactobacillus sp. THM19-2]
MEKIIKVDNVSYQYTEDHPWVLQDVSFSVNRGEWLAIIGHNGSGKSTLAKCLNGLLLPQKGTVHVGGYDTRDKSAIWEIRRQVGMVFQNPDNQFVGATVQDDVAFGMENHGIPRDEMIKRLKESLKLVRMDQFASQEPHRLSGGQKQRVAIAGIVALQPMIIILDEATSMLDPEGRREIIRTMRTLNRTRGITVLSITHDLNEAIYADRVLVMNNGRMIREGGPREIFQTPELLEKIGLDLPFSIKLRNLLREKGVGLSDHALTQEELVNELWTLRSQK